MKPALTPDDYERAAEALDCEIAAILAVCTVEAPGGGFNPDGSPVTLFEGHKFSKFTKGRYDLTNPSISYPTWSRQFYGKNWQEEQVRLRTARALDNRAALLSASWGKFQIMGFNHLAAGFGTVEAFVDAMHVSEGAQLDAFVSLVKAWGLAPALKAKDWATFARKYNGPGYSQNKYDIKLAVAYNRFSGA